MLTFDSGLQSSLNAATSKQDWVNRLASALGSSRKLRGYWEAVDSGNTAANGAKFLDADLVGNIASASGVVAGLGKVANVVTRTAVDLAAGHAVLRIEGNGHWVQGVLGLTGSAADFKMSGNPSATTGFGFAGLSLSAPKGLPTGNGPYAPALDVDAPHSIELENWIDPENPVVVGSLVFDTERERLVFDDAEIAAECGDTRVLQSSQSIIFGSFEFGATLLSLSQLVNDEAAKPLHQVIVSCKPYGTWAGYPAIENYDAASDVTFPDACKLRIKRANGTVLHTIEMHDGLPVNHPTLTHDRTGTTAARPPYNCSQWLYWESAAPKKSSKATKFVPRMRADSLRPSQCKTGASTNAAMPTCGNYIGANSGLQYFALPRWPLPGNSTAAAADTNNDPYLFNTSTYYSGPDNSPSFQVFRAVGWDYEPGSQSGHDWYTGPGGSRADRAVVPSILALCLTDPNGAILKDGTPYKQRASAWGKAYFNYALHHVTDVKTLASVPLQDVLDGYWSYGKTYYGSLYGKNNSGYVTTGGMSRHIPQFVANQARGDVDKYGRPPWNSCGHDFNHIYNCPGLWALAFNSPAHAVSQKFSLIAAQLSQLGGNRTSLVVGAWMRQQAWRWLHFAVSWKLSSTHPQLGIPRAAVEKRWLQEIDAMYDTWVVPATDTSHGSYNSLQMRCLRAYGQPCNPSPRASNETKLTAGSYTWAVLSNPLVYYMASVWLLMKQTGSWEVMYNKSVKARTTLEFMMSCYDKYCFDFLLDTDGWHDTYVPLAPEGTNTSTSAPFNADIISWADWSQNIYPKVGVENLIQDANGNPVSRDISMHLRSQYAFIRRDYFPEFPNSRMAAACDKYEYYYGIRAAQVAAATTPADKRNADWPTRFPGLGWFEAPQE